MKSTAHNTTKQRLSKSFFLYGTCAQNRHLSQPKVIYFEPSFHRKVNLLDRTRTSNYPAKKLTYKENLGLGSGYLKATNIKPSKNSNIMLYSSFNQVYKENRRIPSLYIKTSEESPQSKYFNLPKSKTNAKAGRSLKFIYESIYKNSSNNHQKNTSFDLQTPLNELQKKYSLFVSQVN